MFEDAAKRTKHKMSVLMKQAKKDEENPDRKINDGKDKGSTQNSTQGFSSPNSHFLKGQALLENCFPSQKSSRGEKSMSSRAGMQRQRKSWKNNWESREGAGQGAQEQFLLSLFHTQLLLLPGCGNTPAQRSFPPQIPP